MNERAYGASARGKSHIKLKKPNQDSFLVDNKEDYILAVVCDGLGSKKYSHVGSKKLCKILKKQINKCFKLKSLDIEELIPVLKIKWKRAIWPIPAHKADTTCIFVVLSKKNIIMCQIGDGLCALRSGDELIILSPKNDDFSNETTTFFKSSIKDWRVEVLNIEKECNYKILLCTDGISEDLKFEVLSDFIEEIANAINNQSGYKDNEEILEIINNWPNKYSNDDKTMVVIK